MTDQAPSTRVRRTITGLCMIAAPALLVAGEVLHPRFETEAAAQFAAVSDAPAQQYAAHLTFYGALVLFVPAILGVVRLIGVPRARWGYAGAALAAAGAFALAIFLGAEFVLWQAVKAPEADRAAMVSLFERLNESPGVLPFYALAVAFPAGWFVLGLGLRLARATTTWEAALIAVAPVVTLGVELGGGPRAVVVIGAIAFLVGLGSLGRRVLADERWDRAPAPAAV